MSSFKLLKYPTLVQKQIIEEMDIQERLFFSSLSTNACSHFRHLGVRKIGVYEMHIDVSCTAAEIRLNYSYGWLIFKIFYYTKIDRTMNFILEKTSLPVSIGRNDIFKHYHFSVADYTAGKMKAVVEIIGKLTKLLSCISNIETCHVKYTHPLTSLFPNVHGVQKFGKIEISNYAGPEKGMKLTVEDFDIITNSKYLSIQCSLAGMRKTVNTFLKGWVAGNHTNSEVAHIYVHFCLYSNRKITDLFTGIETTESTTTVEQMKSIKSEYIDQTVDIYRQSDQMRATVGFDNKGSKRQSQPTESIRSEIVNYEAIIMAGRPDVYSMWPRNAAKRRSSSAPPSL
ncbi:hypothetical protein L3Y34_009364 [Caenorhabditis briggsae]|uniref:F-box domain-containing protein n=1 Tax=Caenorhabditis briggsae TaxID=6238 RepID=A0AAE9A582_CAEBR|nr:hypothetical protein L3Y34_009364 [Caenorhabditis briggsae]